MQSSLKDKPRYRHGNCKACVFLGQMAIDGYHFDLYWCPQMGNLPTIIARYGSGGPDYSSGLHLARQSADGNLEPDIADEPYIIAMGIGYLRAKGLGLYVKENS